MGPLPERVAHLEGQMVEQSQTLVATRADIRDLDQRLDQRMSRLEQRMDRLEQQTNHLERSLNDKMSRQFLWLVGIQVTTFVVIISAILVRG